MKLFTMYGLEKAQAASTTGDQLGPEGPRVLAKPLVPARQKKSFTEQQLVNFSGLHQ